MAITAFCVERTLNTLATLSSTRSPNMTRASPTNATSASTRSRRNSACFCTCEHIWNNRLKNFLLPLSTPNCPNRSWKSKERSIWTSPRIPSLTTKAFPFRLTRTMARKSTPA
uniref:(northern house mosquito) hypothetical protein n=1 Tax=Culex pipiens TaxID=7175 RepID=A0A8D8HY47_CULPI